MRRKKLAGASSLALVILVMTLVAAAGSWQQVNENGFGDPQADEVSALETFDGALYAGTSNATNGARIFRSPDALIWTAVTDPGFGIPHDTAPPTILDLAVFDGRLYASTGRGDGPGQIWRTLNGLNWAPVVIAGFSDPDTVDITALAVYHGLIYAGASNLVNGAQIWRSYTGDSNTWTQVAPDVPATGMARVTGFATFDGALYAAVSSDAPPQIWRSYGAGWTTVMSDGFGDVDVTSTGGMAAFGDHLYVGAANLVEGAQLWRTNDGASWEQVIDPGFGDANNEALETVFVYQHQLHVSVKNATTGTEIWRWTDSALWEQINLDGFGDSDNAGSSSGNAVATYVGRLYVGTANVADGGELWQMTPSANLGVVLSADDSQTGLVGATVTYTVAITNSGDVSDTYNLALSGNLWAAALSSSSIELESGVSGSFLAYTTIPADAACDVPDVLTVVATSQSDSAVSDSVVLTTTCIRAPLKSYLPVILWRS